MENKRNLSLYVNRDEYVEENHYYVHYLMEIIKKDGNTEYRNQPNFALNEQELILKALFDGNECLSGMYESISIPRKDLFAAAFRTLKHYLHNDNYMIESLEGYDFDETFQLKSYMTAYMLLLAYLDTSKYFNEFNKVFEEETETEFLKEVVVCEFIKRVSEDTECYCDVNLVHIFHSNSYLDDIDRKYHPEINSILDDFIAGINSEIFVDDEEMEEIRQLVGTMDELSEKLENGDAIIIKGEIPEKPNKFKN